MKLGQQEFERLALEQMDMLHRIARRLTHNATEAEDLVQETFLRAFRARENFDLQEFGIRPWLLRILHNLHFSRAQKNKRQPRAVEDEHLETAVNSSASEANDPPLQHGSFEGMDQQLVRAIDSLPEEYQAVLLLWAVDELSYKEISDSLHVPIGTVMSRLHRARQKLSEQLHGYAIEQRIIRE